MSGVGRFRWAAALALGALGAAVNLVPIQLSPGTDLLFGGVFYLLAAVALGPGPGVLAAAVGALPTIALWNHPWAWLIFCAEGAVVGWVARRWEFRPLVADLIFWVALGVPLLFLTYGILLEFSGYTATVVYLKHVFNGLMHALLAETLLLAPQVRRLLRLPERLGLRFTLATVIALAAVLPTLLFGVWEGRQAWDRSVSAAAERAQMAARAYGARIELYVRLHEQAVRAAANTAAASGRWDAADLQRMVEADRINFPGFANLYAADSRARTVAFSPLRGTSGGSNLGLDFSDREYYRLLRETRASVVSNVFLGRHGVDLPLVVLAHPVMLADTMAGYLLGALDLQVFPEPAALVAAQRLRLVDQRGTLVFDTDSDYRPGENPKSLADSAVFRTIRASGAPRRAVTYALNVNVGAPAIAARRMATVAAVPTLGWWVWVEQSYAEVQRDAGESYVRLFLLLVGVTLGALLVSGVIAHYIAGPLRRLQGAAAELGTGNLDARVGGIGPAVPLEVAGLAREFDAMAATTARRAHEMRELAERAEEASRAKTDFIATMSHELRTPLNAIVGHLELMEMGIHGELTAGQAGAIERVRLASRHLRGLIEEVLSFSRLEAGRVEVNRTETDLCEIAHEVATVIGPLAGEKGLDLAVDCSDAAAARVTTDADKVRQILINLAGNAVKFTEEGEVRLAVRARDGEIELSVTDTGVGIDPADQARLFRAFEQLEGGLARNHGGTGLGLYLSGRYASLIDGRIEVRSAVGEGSTFSLLLPHR